MTNKLLMIALVSLVAGPLLAGCADNTGTTPTPTTATSMTPTTPASPTSPTSATPTVPIPTMPPRLLGLELKLGLMMPITGGLNTLGPDMRDGALMAVEEINNANVGIRVTVVGTEDDGTTDSAGAPNKFNRLVGLGATGVVGPCCSGVTGAILDLAVQNEVVVASPSATSPALTLTRENEGFFWRVAPSDAVQGKVLANLAKEDGTTSVAMLIVNNPYGNGLAGVFESHFESIGGSVVHTEKHNEDAQEFSGAVTAVCSKTAQGLVLVTYIDQAANILKEMNKQGCLTKFSIYGSEGIYKGNGPEGLPEKAGKDSQNKWLAAGIRGTSPAAGDNASYVAKFTAKYPGNAPGLYSPESYDGVMYIALAALAAESVEGEDMAAELKGVANDGVKLNDFRTAAIAILAGQDVDWVGQAHDFDYDDNHEPDTGIYSWWVVGDDGQVSDYATGKSA